MGRLLSAEIPGRHGTAAIHSLIETAKLNGVDAEAYLRDVLVNGE